MSNYIDFVMKRGVRRFGKEIAGATLAATLATGAALGAKEASLDKPQVTHLDQSSNTIRENSQTDHNKPNFDAQEQEKPKETSKFKPHEFLYSEFDELGVDKKIYAPVLEKMRKDYIQDRFKGNPEIERKYFKNKLSENFKEKQEVIFAAAQKHGVPPEMLQAVCYNESGCLSGSTSEKGAAGPMQLMPKTARTRGLIVDVKEGVDERMDLGKSATASAEYLSHLHERFGQWGLALVAYSGGGGKLSRKLRKLFPECFPDRRVKQDIKITRAKILSLKNGSQKNELRRKMRALQEQEKELEGLIVGRLKEEGVNLAMLASPKYGNMNDDKTVKYAGETQIMAGLIRQHQDISDEEWQPKIDQYNAKAAKKREKRKRRKANSKKKKARKLAESSRKQNN